jgi:hypothetical protein
MTLLFFSLALQILVMLILPENVSWGGLVIALLLVPSIFSSYYRKGVDIDVQALIPATAPSQRALIAKTGETVVLDRTALSWEIGATMITASAVAVKTSL